MHAAAGGWPLEFGPIKAPQGEQPGAPEAAVLRARLEGLRRAASVLQGTGTGSEAAVQSECHAVEAKLRTLRPLQTQRRTLQAAVERRRRRLGELRSQMAELRQLEADEEAQLQQEEEALGRLPSASTEAGVSPIITEALMSIMAMLYSASLSGGATDLSTTTDPLQTLEKALELPQGDGTAAAEGPPAAVDTQAPGRTEGGRRRSATTGTDDSSAENREPPRQSGILKLPPWRRPRGKPGQASLAGGQADSRPMPGGRGAQHPPRPQPAGGQGAQQPP